MGKASFPKNEKSRIRNLRSYKILDSLAEQSYNDIVLIASQICEVPISAISFIDQERQWFKAKTGLDASETSRDVAFCAHAILQEDILVVEDASRDDRFKDNPFVQGGPKIQFYAGAPLVTSDGFSLGTLCVIDTKPRKLTPAQVNTLRALSRQVIALLELRKSHQNEIQQNMVIKAVQERYRIVIDNLKETVFQTDAHGCWTFLSPAWEEVSGYSITESLGQFFLSYGAPAELALQQNKFLIMVKQKQEEFQQFVPFFKKDGSQIWIEIFARLNWDSSGHFTGTTGTLADVTQKILAQKKIEEQRFRLASSAKLSALGEMAGGIAHEINNPLAIIAGKIQLLKRKARTEVVTSEQIIEASEKIESTVGRIAKIISGLRNFARDGEKDPFQEITIGKIMEGTLELCKSRFTHHDVTLKVELEDPNRILSCQPTQISQVILNLLNNAFDAVINQSDRWVILQTAVVGQHLEICVSDSGPGIPVDIRDKIMQPFFTTKPAGKGTGLGLSLSKGIAEVHKGHFFLNTESRHTEFKLLIPISVPVRASS